MAPTKDELMAALVDACDAVSTAAKKSHDPHYVILGEDLKLAVERYEQATRRPSAG